MKNYLGLSYTASLSALGVATCCVLPMVFMLIGLGGGWLAIFGKIAAASFFVLGISTILVGLAWLMSIRRGTVDRLKWLLTGSTGLTMLAWIVVFNETRINDYLLNQM